MKKQSKKVIKHSTKKNVTKITNSNQTQVFEVIYHAIEKYLNSTNLKRKDVRVNSTSVRYNDKATWTEFKTFCASKGLIPTAELTKILTNALGKRIFNSKNTSAPKSWTRAKDSTSKSQTTSTNTTTSKPKAKKAEVVKRKVLVKKIKTSPTTPSDLIPVLNKAKE